MSDLRKEVEGEKEITSTFLQQTKKKFCVGEKMRPEKEEKVNPF